MLNNIVSIRCVPNMTPPLPPPQHNYPASYHCMFTDITILIVDVNRKLAISLLHNINLLVMCGLNDYNVYGRRQSNKFILDIQPIHINTNDHIKINHY